MCCYYKVEREFELDEAIPIGRPFANTEILLLKEDNTPAGRGETGEICIRGTSLTLGYYSNLYNDTGELVFVSRKDYQIKHMGHRIELGEIEVNVNMLEEIKSSGCIYDLANGKIVLYYVGEIPEKELIALLKEKLPRYMIPNYVRKLEQMPHTANGKVDRVTLMKYHQENTTKEKR